MKKNLVTVITLALVLVNLVLTVVLTISIIPETKKANELIAKVCGAIDLELESGSASSAENIPIDQIEVYSIEDSLTINLKKGDDGQDHFAIVKVALSIDTKNKDYKKLQPQLAKKDSLIRAEVVNVVSQYTLDEIKNNQTAVQEEILKNLQKKFASDFIVAVGFPDAQYQ